MKQLKLDKPENCCVYFRYGLNPSTKSPYGGFRFAATPE